jgi:hypothetical protein
MKYPACPVNPVYSDTYVIGRAFRFASHVIFSSAKILTPISSVVCRLLFTLSREGKSLASLFTTPLLCFESLVACPPVMWRASFCKSPGVGYPGPSSRCRLPRDLSARGGSVFALVCYQQLLSCPPQTIDPHLSQFHALMSCSFRNPFVFTFIRVAPCVFQENWSLAACLFRRYNRAVNLRGRVHESF